MIIITTLPYRRLASDSQHTTTADAVRATWKRTRLLKQYWPWICVVLDVNSTAAMRNKRERLEGQYCCRNSILMKDSGWKWKS